jgi:hypothetical protein
MSDDIESLEVAMRVKRVLVELVAALVLVVGGGLVMWGGYFATNMVHDQLQEQKISFPAQFQPTDDKNLAKYAGKAVDTGPEAKAYSRYIKGHLAETNEGKTYSQTSTEARAASAAAATAKTNKAADVDALQAKATDLNNKVQTLFRGETLRGLLLYAWGWWLVGTIAKWVAVGMFLAAGLLLVAAVLTRPRHGAQREIVVMPDSPKALEKV